MDLPLDHFDHLYRLGPGIAEAGLNAVSPLRHVTAALLALARARERHDS